jgi:hypothetical protein
MNLSTNGTGLGVAHIMAFNIEINVKPARRL